MKSLFLFTFDMPFLQVVHLYSEGNKRTSMIRILCYIVWPPPFLKGDWPYQKSQEKGDEKIAGG